MWKGTFSELILRYLNKAAELRKKLIFSNVRKRCNVRDFVYLKAVQSYHRFLRGEGQDHICHFIKRRWYSMANVVSRVGALVRRKLHTSVDNLNYLWRGCGDK